MSRGGEGGGGLSFIRCDFMVDSVCVWGGGIGDRAGEFVLHDCGRGE